MKKISCWILVLVMILACACAQAESAFSYEGTVVAGETVPVAAPYGGRIGKTEAYAGGWIKAGDPVCEIKATLQYAPVEGTITGLYAAAGDTTESVTERYGAVLYIEPTHKYVIQATNEKAFNQSDNYFIHLGEKVYLKCAKDGSHRGTGIVSALTETGYHIEVTGGEFYLNEKVEVFRGEGYEKETCLGRGDVGRAKPVAVKGSGSILKMHVAEGDFVERGEALFETVEGTLDGLYAPESGILSPVKGVVTAVEKNSGDTVAKGDTLIKIAPEDAFLVQFDVPESDVFALKAGQEVNMELYWADASGERYPGTISRIAYMTEEVKEGTSTRKIYRVLASFKPDETIRLGMTMVVYPLDATKDSMERE